MTTNALDDLLAFVAVARTGSFKVAAKQLGRDASVISRRISQLEARLGVKLLTRTTRSVALTEAGSMYFQRLRLPLEDIESASREVSSFVAVPQGVLRISVPVTFCRELITPLFSDIVSAFPSIKIDAHFEDRSVDVTGEGYDMVIRVGVLPSSSLICRQLGSFKNLLVAAPTYEEKYSLPTTPQELEEHACLGFTKYPEWPSWVLAREGEQVAVQPNCSIVADSSEAILVSALQGGGIAFVPDLMAAPYLETGRLVEVLPGWRSVREIAIHALMPPGSLIPAKTRILVDALKDAFQSERTRLKRLGGLTL